MAERIYINNDWKFSETFLPEMTEVSYDDSQMAQIRIPHTCKETPFHYFDEQEYQMISGYRKVLYVPKQWEKKQIFLTFEGVGHVCEVFVNGEKAGEHFCGYTAFTIDITSFLQYGCDNVLAVKVNSREDSNIPPFGFVIDYMTYGGIYRDVYLELKNEVFLEDIFVHTKPELKLVRLDKEYGRITERAAVISHIKLNQICGNTEVRQSMKYHFEVNYHVLDGKAVETDAVDFDFELENICLWDTDYPNLYDLRTEVLVNGVLVDEQIVTFGFRRAEFRVDGFYLNGEKFRIRGLNRHQSYPYVGYAMPQSMQEMDAEILKHELGLNAVRTSHYPQSHYFLNRCDELGLLVFTEIPGWQHIGDDVWKKQAIENTRDMVKQYRNHTSIILWGVRINESQDDEKLYAETNKVAHDMDPTRQTAGVRAAKKGIFQEDVFTYNDFVHSGDNRGCLKKKDVTSDMAKPYMVTEYNGHMFPTKAFDSEDHRVNHALRHAAVLNAVAGEYDISGSFGWCMADYNTHKDFGSGDRICYHGVLDMFRNKKLAADVYASQQEEVPVLTITSTMDLGEHPGSNYGNAYIFTNADSVKMYKNGVFVTEYKKDHTEYKNLAHGPMLIDDFIGNLIWENENFKPAQTADLTKTLNVVAQYGVYDLPKSIYPTAAKLFLIYRMKFDQLMELYSKYVGNWGNEFVEYRFEAIKDGKAVKTVVKKPMKSMKLKAVADHVELMEKNSYDVAAVRIQAVDENGNQLPYYQEPVRLTIEGPGTLIGPDVISLKGGMGGTYVKTTGAKGRIRLTMTTAQTEPVVLEMRVTEVNHN